MRARAESARSTSSTKRVSPGSQPTVEIVVRRWVTPRSGSRRAASSAASKFSIGSPIPMKTTWSIDSRRRKCSAWSRISHAVRLRRKLHLSGRAERAGQRAARTATTGRPTAGRRGSASAPPRPGARRRCGRAPLRVPSAAFASVDERERRERDVLREPLAHRRRQVRHLGVRRRAARTPTPTPGGCGRRARRRAPSCECASEVPARRARSGV